MVDLAPGTWPVLFLWLPLLRRRGLLPLLILFFHRRYPREEESQAMCQTGFV